MLFAVAAGVGGRDADVDAARANLKAAQTNAAEAEQFSTAVARERAAAYGRLDKAGAAIALAGKAAATDPDPVAVQARRAHGLAEEQAATADAKTHYAADLLALRNEQIDLRQAELDLVRARANLAHHDWLADKVPERSLDRDDFVKAARGAEAEARQKRTAVETMRTAVETSERGWRDARRHFLAAARSLGETAADVPPPSRPLD